MPHEEAIVITPLDEKMENELVKANVTDAVISALKEKYGNLRLRTIDDKEMYLEIKSAKKDCAKLRNLTVKVCKEGREDAVAMQKKWVAKEREVVSKIQQVENPLEAEIDRFDAETKRKEDEEKQRQENQYMQRTQALTKMGALYSDNSFALGDFSLEANLVKESSQSVWDEEILPKFNEQYFIIEAERIEQEKVKAEKEAEIKRQQDELIQQQREFDERQAAFKKQQEEATRIEREKLQEEQRKQNELQNSRVQQLLKYNQDDMFSGDMWKLSESEFSERLETEKQKYNGKMAIKAKAIAEKAAQAERLRIEEEQKLAEIKRQQEEQRKAEELAKAGDKAIWADFIQKIERIEYPKMKSGQYKKIGNIAVEKLNEILALKPY